MGPLFILILSFKCFSCSKKNIYIYHSYKSVRTDLPQQTDQRLIKTTETSENWTSAIVYFLNNKSDLWGNLSTLSAYARPVKEQ